MPSWSRIAAFALLALSASCSALELGEVVSDFSDILVGDRDVMDNHGAHSTVASPTAPVSPRRPGAAAVAVSFAAPDGNAAITAASTTMKSVAGPRVGIVGLGMSAGSSTAGLGAALEACAGVVVAAAAAAAVLAELHPHHLALHGQDPVSIIIRGQTYRVTFYTSVTIRTTTTTTTTSVVSFYASDSADASSSFRAYTATATFDPPASATDVPEPPGGGRGGSGGSGGGGGSGGSGGGNLVALPPGESGSSGIWSWHAALLAGAALVPGILAVYL
ncbi:hypothetical protein RJ035_004423 [Blastomyces gilchristii]